MTLHKLQAATALALVALTSACGALFGVDFETTGPSTPPDAHAPDGNDGATVDEPTPVGPDGRCASNRKRCDDLCVSRGDPAYGCEATACAPCSGRDNGVAVCSAGTCAIACNVGYVEQGGVCMLDSFPERVSAGVNHTCGIKSDGSVVCWGDNSNEQGSPPPGSFKQVSAGDAYTCGVKTDGTVACWGKNADGASTPPPGTFRQVSANRNGLFTCGVKTDGTLACWGRQVTASVPASGIFREVSVGMQTCGVRTDNTLVCWGLNQDGFDKTPPGTFLHVSVGDYGGTSNGVYSNATAVRTDGTIASWMDTQESPFPPAVRMDLIDTSKAAPTGTFLAVTASGHSCALRTDNTVSCWGTNADGQATAPPDFFHQVSAGNSHSCGVKNDGTVACWGDHASGKADPPPGTFW